MKNQTRFLMTVCIAVSCGLTGCADQAVHDQQQANIAEYKEDGRDWVVDTAMTALTTVLSAMDDQYLTLIKKREATPAFTVQGAMGDLITVYSQPTDPSMAIMMMGVSKAMIIREFKPIFVTITEELQTNLEHQITAEEVLLKVAGDLPLLTSIGGMAHLSVKAVEAAGDTIIANLLEGSAFGKDGATANGVYKPWTDNSTAISTEHAPAE